MSVHPDTTTTPTADAGLEPGQVERLARAATERLFVDVVTPETDETNIVHVYSEDGEKYTADVESGACDCPDATYNLTPDEKCKHALRAELALGCRGLPEWADGDAVDRMLRKRLGAREVAVCECSSCGYSSPGVEAGPDVGCGICPSCGQERLERDTREVLDGV